MATKPPDQLEWNRLAPRADQTPPMPLESILRGMNSSGLNKSGSSEWGEAMRAARLLAVNSPERLLQLTRKEAANYRRHTLVGAGVSISSVALVSLIALNDPSMVMWYVVGAVSLMMALWLMFYIPSRARRSLIDVLEELHDPRFLGAALTMLVPDGITEVKTSITANVVVRGGITTAMKKMLPQIRREHRDLLTKEQMQTLLVLMKRSQGDVMLTVGILRALAQIGSAQEASAVNALTKSWNAAVRQTAHESLEIINLRAHEKQQSQTLLRASDGGSAVGQEQLLRSANSAGADAVSEQLLRPQI